MAGTGVSVVGVGTTKYGKQDRSARELAVEAADRALQDAGMAPTEVGAVFVANAFSVADRQGHLGPLVTTALGIPHVASSVTEAACASAAVAFRHALAYVKAGLVETALVVGTEKVSHIDTVTATGYFCYGSDYFLEGGVGATFPGLYAAIARAHMAEHGTTEEDLALVAVKNHEHALKNPSAHLQKAITVRDVLDSYKVATPLKLYDACPFSDGAAAAIITRADAARQRSDTPVDVLASAQSGTIAALAERDTLTSIEGTRRAGRAALEAAGLRPAEVSLFEVHDCFTIAELVASEDLGLFAPGKAAAAVRDGVTRRDGDHPINVSGGLKAKGHPVGATGLGQIYEAVVQLRGEAQGRQVDGATTALTHNVGATGGTVAVHVLGRRA